MKPDGAHHRTPARPVNRRDLFRFRSGTSGAVAPDAMPPAPTSASASDRDNPASRGGIINASRPLMGSYFEVRVGSGVPGAVDLATRALDVIEAIETCLTVYNDSSEVSEVNASAHLGPVRVSDDLFQVLRKAIAVHQASDGAFDPTAGALSMAWGFTRGPKRVPDAATLADARSRTGAHLVELDPENQTIRFRKPGVVLNFGSIGKGYAVDRAVDVIRSHWWPTTALIHGGRSSLFALGSPPDDFGGRWGVALSDPDHREESLGTIHLRNRGMATSGSSFQRFEVGGRTYGHIIDPRTGEPPVGPSTSVTVLAPSAAEADALSTAFYLLGPDRSAPILEGRPDVAALFVDRLGPDGSPRIVPFHLGTADYSPGSTRA